MKAWPVALVLFCAGAARADGPFDPFNLAGVDERPGAAVPMDVALTDDAGQATTLRTLAGGKPLLLVPVQHHCPNICGATLSGLAAGLAGQPLKPGPDYRVVAFGIDPRETASDAAASAARLREGLGAQAGVSATVADRKAIAAVTGALGYRYAWDSRIGQYAHVAAIAVVMPGGRLSGWVYGVQPPSEVLVASLRAAKRGGLAAFGQRLLLFCYHYDPVSGRYASRVQMALRIGGGAITLLLAGLIAWGLLRERRRGVSA